MTTEALKSAWLTDLDATPAVRDTTGEGPNGVEQVATGYCTTTTNKTSGSTYRFLRVPATCKIKQLIGDSAAMSTSTAHDIGLYYSANPSDASYAVHAGAVIDADFFASAWDVSSAVKDVALTNESGSYTIDKRNMPLWQAAGVATEPPKGTYFDIAATSTATITAGGVFGITGRWVI